jgi:hypothetical protein
MNDLDDLHAVIARYQEIVLLYEALDESIDYLITEFGGMSENMPPEMVEVYRALAAQRDDAYNEVCTLGQMLALDDTGGA